MINHNMGIVCDYPGMNDIRAGVIRLPIEKARKYKWMSVRIGPVGMSLYNFNLLAVEVPEHM